MKKNLMISVIFFIFLSLFSCSSNSIDKKMFDLLSNIEYVGDVEDHMEKEAYRISYALWEDRKELCYYIEYPEVKKDGVIIQDYFTDQDKKYIKQQTFVAAQQWVPHIGMTVNETTEAALADIIITWKFLINDGKGGNLALASFPPTKGQLTTPSIEMDLADMWEYVKQRDKAIYPYYNVILHEFGHTLAGLRHDISHGVMNTSFNYSQLQIDDIVGARHNYGITDDFIFEDKRYVFIYKEDLYRNVSTHFIVKEILSKCSQVNDMGHYFNYEVILGLQIIRNHYQTPIKILSTFRDVACNKAVGGASKSQHMFYNALDWKFVGKDAAKIQSKWEKDIVNKELILEKLLRIGIKGFGTYPYGYGTNHIDTRKSLVYNRIHKDITYTIWGEFVNRGGFNVLEEFGLYD